MKTIIAILNWFGLFTKNQYESVTKENEKLRKEKNSTQIYITQLKESNKNLPFEFDILIGKYSKAELNALTYKIINHVRNTPNLRDLLTIWDKRAKNAKSTIKE